MANYAMPNPRFISFVVPAWNEESVLAPTLEALNIARRQLTEPSEVIVADDSSTDRTAEIAHQHGARVVSVRHRQISATRNAGAREAQGDVLIFIDADTIVTPEAVCAAVEAVRGGVIGGGCAIRYSGRIPAYLRVFIPIEVWFARKMRLAFGCFLFCTRAAFDAVGGFDTNIYATEEVTLSLALHRQGRFVCLRECVSTSGRKLRTHSTLEWFAQIYRITFARKKYIHDRNAMGVWYGERRPDPELSERREAHD
jgi:glycosyltransferase involved in cell wall biosynthesis